MSPHAQMAQNMYSKNMFLQESIFRPNGRLLPKACHTYLESPALEVSQGPQPTCSCWKVTIYDILQIMCAVSQLLPHLSVQKLHLRLAIWYPVADLIFSFHTYSGLGNYLRALNFSSYQDIS